MRKQTMWPAEGGASRLTDSDSCLAGSAALAGSASGALAGSSALAGSASGASSSDASGEQRSMGPVSFSFSLV